MISCVKGDSNWHNSSYLRKGIQRFGFGNNAVRSEKRWSYTKSDRIERAVDAATPPPRSVTTNLKSNFTFQLQISFRQ